MNEELTNDEVEIDLVDLGYVLLSADQSYCRRCTSGCVFLFLYRTYL